MKKIPALIAATAISALLLTGCSEQAPVAESSDTAAAPVGISGVFQGDDAVPAAVDKPLEVALVTRITTGSWYETYSRAVEAEVAALGGTLQVYDSNNDLAKMASNVDTAINAKSDILLINNGTAEALGASVTRAIAAGIPVVTYDSDLAIDGVSAINQDDTALATTGLKALATDFDDKANIVVLSVAGYPPLDRRLAAVDAFVSDHPGVKIVTQTGTVSGSPALDTAAQVSALLTANSGKGEIDAIWSHWNEFTRGAITALKEAGRSDVAVYTVDLTDQELPYFWDSSVDFRAASATNPATIGRSQVRQAYVKAAGEKIGDLTLAPSLVTRAELPEKEIPFDQLGNYVKAWNEDTSVWPAWIRTLAERND